MNKKKIAIILVNYNGFEDTKTCLESLDKMHCEAEIGIFVVDNASRENEAEKLQQIFPKIKAILSHENLGFAGGNNLAIQEAMGAGYTDIMLLNNDTVVDKQMLERLLEEQDENSILVPKMLYYSDPDTIWYGGGEINKKTGNSVHFKKGEPDDKDDCVRNCTFATGCCMLIPAIVVKKIGVLEHSYFMYCEDTEYCLRAMKNGIRIKYVPAAKLWHKVSQSTGGEESAFSVYYMTRNRLRYLKDYKEFFTTGAFFFSVVSRMIRGIQYAIQGKKSWKAFFKAMADSHKGITGQVENIFESV